MKWIKLITDRYTKKPDSNIGKLISMIEEEVEELLVKTNESMVYYQDIYNARGKVLDRYGEDVGQPRLGMDDESYLFMMLTKDRADYSRGDIETINEMMTLLIGDNYKGMVETWTSPLYDEKAGIVLYYDFDRFFPILKLDGTAKLDGEYILAGLKPGEFRSESHEYMRRAIKRIVERGVKIYFAVPQTHVIDAKTEYTNFTTWKNDRYVNAKNEYTFGNQVSNEYETNKALRLDGSTQLYGLHNLNGERRGKYYFGLEVIQ